MIYAIKILLCLYKHPPSYFEATNYKIIDHLSRSIHETNKLSLGISLKMTKIIVNFGLILSTNIETNLAPAQNDLSKRPGRLLE